MCPRGVERTKSRVYINPVPQSRSKAGTFVCSEGSTSAFPLQTSQDLNSNKVTSYPSQIIHRELCLSEVSDKPWILDFMESVVIILIVWDHLIRLSKLEHTFAGFRVILIIKEACSWPKTHHRFFLIVTSSNILSVLRQQQCDSCPSSNWGKCDWLHSKAVLQAGN